jgi:hypothetical protein
MNEGLITINQWKSIEKMFGNSKNTYRDSINRKLKHQLIQLPIHQFLQNTKNFIIHPTLSTLIGNIKIKSGREDQYFLK